MFAYLEHRQARSVAQGCCGSTPQYITQLITRDLHLTLCETHTHTHTHTHTQHTQRDKHGASGHVLPRSCQAHTCVWEYDGCFSGTCARVLCDSHSSSSWPALRTACHPAVPAMQRTCKRAHTYSRSISSISVFQERKLWWSLIIHSVCVCVCVSMCLCVCHPLCVCVCVCHAFAYRQLCLCHVWDGYVDA